MPSDHSGPEVLPAVSTRLQNLRSAVAAVRSPLRDAAPPDLCVQNIVGDRRHVEFVSVDGHGGASSKRSGLTYLTMPRHHPGNGSPATGDIITIMCQHNSQESHGKAVENQGTAVKTRGAAIHER